MSKIEKIFLAEHEQEKYEGWEGKWVHQIKTLARENLYFEKTWMQANSIPF